MRLLRKKEKQIDLPKPTKPLEFSAAGTKYFTEAIESLGILNPKYNASYDEFIENNYFRQYEYLFPYDEIHFISDVNNAYDPNAIMITVQGVKVGYIPQVLQSEFRYYAKFPMLVSFEITGGNYRHVITYYDKVNDKAVSEIEKVQGGYFINIKISPQ